MLCECENNGALCFSTGIDNTELFPLWHISCDKSMRQLEGRRSKLTTSVSFALYFNCASDSIVNQLILIKI